MSGNRQPLTPDFEQELRPKDAAPEPFQVGDPLPVRLDVLAMCRIFRVGRSGFHRLERQGKFRRFELTPQIGHKAWSGLKVARYLTGNSFAIEVKRRA